MSATENDTLEAVHTDFASALARMGDLNAAPDTRCRELSLAITNAEQALMWLEKAAKVIAATTKPGNG